MTAMAAVSAFVARMSLWTLTLAGVVAGLAWLVAGPMQALSVGLGAAIGLLNLLSLTRAAVRVLAEATADPQTTAARQSRTAPLLATLRWPATALATAAVLWYMPGRPEGLVTGVLVALVAFAAAALRLHHSLLHSTSTGPSSDG